MTGQEIIYQEYTPAEKAYALKAGEIIFQVTEDLQFSDSGKNIIFGAGEILLEDDTKFQNPRYLTVLAGAGCEYTTIPKQNLLKLMSSYNIGFNVCKYIARNIKKLHQIYNQKNKELSSKEKMATEYCKIYAATVQLLSEEFAKRRYPWLEELVQKYANSLTNEKGKAFLETQKQKVMDIESEALDEFNKLFPPGSIVCEQGEAGNDMYILKRGKLKILIGDNEIAEITDSGEFIGEMALLLGEPRTATVKSVDETVLTIIKRNQLKKIAFQDKTFFRNMGVILARREAALSNVIRHLSELVKQHQEEEKTPDIITSNRYRDDARSLRDDMKEVYDKTDLDWVYDMVISLTENINSVREKFE